MMEKKENLIGSRIHICMYMGHFMCIDGWILTKSRHGNVRALNKKRKHSAVCKDMGLVLSYLIVPLLWGQHHDGFRNRHHSPDSGSPRYLLSSVSLLFSFINFFLCPSLFFPTSHPQPSAASLLLSIIPDTGRINQVHRPFPLAPLISLPAPPFPIHLLYS